MMDISLLIDGEAVGAGSGATFERLDPVTATRIPEGEFRPAPVGEPLKPSEQEQELSRALARLDSEMDRTGRLAERVGQEEAYSTLTVKHQSLEQAVAARSVPWTERDRAALDGRARALQAEVTRFCNELEEVGNVAATVLPLPFLIVFPIFHWECCGFPHPPPTDGNRDLSIRRHVDCLAQTRLAHPPQFSLHTLCCPLPPIDIAGPHVIGYGLLWPQYGLQLLYEWQY